MYPTVFVGIYARNIPAVKTRLRQLRREVLQALKAQRTGDVRTGIIGVLYTGERCIDQNWIPIKPNFTTKIEHGFGPEVFGLMSLNQPIGNGHGCWTNDVVTSCHWFAERCTTCRLVAVGLGVGLCRSCSEGLTLTQFGRTLLNLASSLRFSKGRT